MAISVPQTASADQVYSAAFPGPVGAGDSVILAVSAFTTAGLVIASHDPLYNSLPVAGAVKLCEKQSPGAGNAVYAALWLLPDLAGGATGVSITVDNGGTSTVVGLHGLDVTGLGATPSLDVSSVNAAATGTAVSSGPTGAIASSPELIVAVDISFGQALTQAGAPWTELTHVSSFTWTGYQVANSAGASFNYQTTAAASAPWAGIIAAVKPASQNSYISISQGLTNMVIAAAGNSLIQGANHAGQGAT